MKKKVIISIQGKQNYPQREPEVIELVTEGTLEDWEGRSLALSYRESEVTGLEGTQTTIQVEPGRVTLLRQGALNSQMIFEEGRQHLSLYETPYGALEIGIRTRKIHSSLNGQGGDVTIYYALEIGHGEAGRNMFHISVHPQSREGLEQRNKQRGGTT